jgi:hypothetical protein
MIATNRRSPLLDWLSLFSSIGLCCPLLATRDRLRIPSKRAGDGSGRRFPYEVIPGRSLVRSQSAASNRRPALQ